MKKRTKLGGAVGAAVLALTTIVGAAAPATASTDSSTDDRADNSFTFLVPEDSASSAEIGDVQPLSAEDREWADISHRLIQMTLANAEVLATSTVFDPDTKQIKLYSAAPEGIVNATIERYGLGDSVVYAPAARSARALDAVIQKLIGDYGVLPSGHQVALAIPSVDGARVELVVDEASKNRTALKLPDVDIPVDITYGPMPVSATRNAAPAAGDPSLFVGAYMQNGQLACTTGFPLSQVGSGIRAMGSAYHCGAGVNSQWYYSSLTSWPIGQFQGGLYPAGMPYGDTALWTGSGVSSLVPGIFVGDHTVSGSTVRPIRGAVSSSVGMSMCYSGSRSGTVCGNVIDQVNVSACYGGGLPCFENLALTKQAVGIPAAGQGDSGGPAYFVGGPGNGIYAAGVISGIRNYSGACTGDTGRSCSAEVLYAPITEFFGANWGLNYYP
ncbi:hypothetical protein [Microbacterium hominis]|uniref:hypothetical protein n=1 Tax=Microbacterium hominis TaxID=162426 RepID=UPI000AF7CC96|nr:hypothetical protein [Microbacterium hominis]